jgi:hypothetical protein
MFEQWQPWWDVVFLLSTGGLLTLWLYIKGEPDE